MFWLFVLFVLGGIGITSIIVDSEFFREVKEWFSELVKNRIKEHGDKGFITWALRKIHYMMYCYQCSGFWVGLWLGIALDPVPVGAGWWCLARYLAYGGCISYVAQIGMALYNYLNVEYAPRNQ